MIQVAKLGSVLSSFQQEAWKWLCQIACSLRCKGKVGCFDEEESDRGVFLYLLEDVAEVTLLELKLTNLGPTCAHFGERGA